MKRLNKYIFIITGVLLLFLTGWLLLKYYPCLEACYYNRYINVSGVKLLMPQEELEKELCEEGEFVYGMGGHGKRFDGVKVFVMISQNGLFAKKVSQIDTENTLHSILGISVDSEYNSALNILKKRGFKQLEKDIFVRGNVHIQLSGSVKISRIRIYITDPAYKNVVW